MILVVDNTCCLSSHFFCGIHIHAAALFIVGLVGYSLVCSTNLLFVVVALLSSILSRIFIF